MYLVAIQSLDWVNDDIRAMLVDTSYVNDKTRDFIDDGTADDPVSHEMGVASYVRQSVTGRSVFRDDTGLTIDLKCDDVDFGVLESGETVGGVVVYRHNASDAAAEIITFDTLEEDEVLDAVKVIYKPASGVVFDIGV